MALKCYRMHRLWHLVPSGWQEELVQGDECCSEAAFSGKPHCALGILPLWVAVVVSLLLLGGWIPVHVAVILLTLPWSSTRRDLREHWGWGKWLLHWQVSINFSVTVALCMLSSPLHRLQLVLHPWHPAKFDGFILLVRLNEEIGQAVGKVVSQGWSIQAVYMCVHMKYTNIVWFMLKNSWTKIGVESIIIFNVWNLVRTKWTSSPEWILEVHIFYSILEKRELMCWNKTCVDLKVRMHKIKLCQQWQINQRVKLKWNLQPCQQFNATLMNFVERLFWIESFFIRCCAYAFCVCLK